MSPPRLSDDEKPHGNVYYTPGTKTPRRVQWFDKDSTSSTHSLDEQGLDVSTTLINPKLELKAIPQPTAFRRLTQALERHQTSTSRVHHYPPQPEPAHTVEIKLNTHLPQNQPSSTDASGATATKPQRPDLLHHVVPGNYIDATERVGLPGMSDSSNRAQAQAEKVVDSHSRRQRFGISSSWPKVTKRWTKTKNVFGVRMSEESHGSIDVEHNAGMDTPEAMRGGVLSTLLSLYGQELDLQSGVSTPACSSLDEPPERPSVHLKEDIRHTFHRSGTDSDEKRHSKLDEEVTPASPSLSRQSTRTSNDEKMSRVHQFPPSSLLHRHRKPKIRSGAGVFGPLIASTGNLTGFVAPTQSQLQPDIKQPGYSLSRYSYDDMLVPNSLSPKTSTRPRSMYDNTSSYAPSLLSTTSSPPSPVFTDPGPSHSRWTGIIKDLPASSLRSFGGRSGASTPARSTSPMLEGDSYFDLSRPPEPNKWKEKRKRKQARIYITRHVAHILERQAFILKFARAMMMFGAPSHRLQSQLSSTAHVLDLEMSCVYLPDVLIISFDDNSTSTSNVKIIRQGSSLDLLKLADAYRLYWKVIHDKLSVSKASSELDTIMRRPQLYNWWKVIIFGGMCSSSICTVSFDGSFIDALVVFPMGALLIVIQLLSVRNELYSNVFEVTVTTLFSFLSAALASSHYFCYSAIASSSVVLILPGFIVLNGALEIMSRNIVAGSVRLCYAVMYALFLGFGLAMGAEAFIHITGSDVVGSTDIACSISHYEGAPWYQRTPSKLWVGISCVGWVTNHFTGTKFVNQSDISAAVGAFAVGIVANMYARIFRGNAFVVMITGILFQLPSGLGSGGLLTYVDLQTQGNSESYISGFQTALKLISVAIGLTVGLGISLVIMHPIQSRRRAGGIFSL
ncbi:hypothetical protein DXG01_017010 [Tephrocybe rancida]|nr:hypothetical protein DXG01_017010 [Tephrocybe rancida]